MNLYYKLEGKKHAIVDVKITNGNFSASASVYENFRKISSGQCLEELAAVDPVLVAMWKEWHLNGSAWIKKELPQSVYDWFNELQSEPFTDWPVVTSVHAQAKKSGFAEFYQHHVVTVKHNRQKINFDFWASKAEPANIDSALDCFLSDADSAYMTADDIESEFEVSIKEAKRLYKAFQKAKAKAEKLGLM